MLEIRLRMFGGRGASSGGPKSGGIAGLKDSNDFRAFVQQNLSNPEFKAFGREQGMDAVRQLWYTRQLQKEDIHQISKEQAIATVRGNIPDNVLHGWFVNADSEYKPKLMEAIASNPGTYNAGLNIAYSNYAERTSNPMSFRKWLNTPQTMYRGDNGQKTVQSDIFTSYTPSKKIAEGFGKNITTKRFKPKDTWGSYQTTGEQEFLIPTQAKKRK